MALPPGRLELRHRGEHRGLEDGPHGHCGRSAGQAQQQGSFRLGPHDMGLLLLLLPPGGAQAARDDIEVKSAEPGSLCVLCLVPVQQAQVLVLGEHTIFLLSENGQLRMQKRLDYPPASICVFGGDTVRRATASLLPRASLMTPPWCLGTTQDPSMMARVHVGFIRAPVSKLLSVCSRKWHVMAGSPKRDGRLLDRKPPRVPKHAARLDGHLRRGPDRNIRQRIRRTQGAAAVSFPATTLLVLSRVEE